ncbi:MAG TPA: hypothetical protein VFV96_18215 [Verrucomicrobiae bacterium]|nr:hypothetical protein [Verrucomicrobiae bacterium]
MIALAEDCILLRRSNGESEPMQAGTIAVEVVTEGESPFDEAFVKEASAAVLHYFKNEEGRESVTLGEFAEALEKVLKGFQFKAEPLSATDEAQLVVETDLQALAADADGAFELTFFPRLRNEMRARLQQSPRVLRFRGLRNCVMRLTGARRWSARCQNLQEQIVQFLRECLSTEPHPDACALVVE